MENQNSSGSDDENEGETVEKRTRGPTYMKDVWGQPSNLLCWKVKFDENGEPIGQNKSKFVDFLGTTARNGLYAPIDIEDWRKITDDQKKEILRVVNEKFKLPLGSEHWILKSIGKKWRNWKAFLKATHYDPNASVESQMNNRDPCVLVDQWRNILLYWKSKKTQAAMREKQGQLPQGVEDCVGRNDIFAQVIGEKRAGHVRTYGLGVCPTDLWGNLPSRNTCHRMVMEQKAAMSNMEDKLADQNQQLKEQAKEIANLKAMVLQQKTNGSTNDLRVHFTSSHIISSSVSNSRALKEGDWVALFSLSESSKVVAIRRLQGTNPSNIVGGHQLGSGWYEILVQIVVEREEQLINLILLCKQLEMH